MTKELRRFISFILVLSMVLGSFSFAFATEPSYGKIAYIGDSMSSGYGFSESDKVNKVYPVFATGVDSSNAISLYNGGMRTTDLYALLKGNISYGDGYTVDYFGNDFSGRVKKYDNTLRKTSLGAVTIMLGHSNLSPYLTGRIAYDLKLNDNAYPASESLKDISNSAITAVMNKFEQNLNSIIEKSTYASIVNDLMNGEFGLNNQKATLKTYVDIITYSLVSEMYYFDKSMEEMNLIREDNPFDLYIMGLFNPIENLKLTFNYELSSEAGIKTVTIPVGEIFGLVFDTFNSYMAIYSPYATDYYYVEPAHNVESFADKLTKTTDYAIQIATSQYGTPLAADLLVNLCAHNTINVNDLTKDCGDIIKAVKDGKLDNIGDATILEILTLVDEYKDNELVLALGYFYALAGVQNGLLIHPSETGHEQIAEKLTAAIEQHTVLPAATQYKAVKDAVVNKSKALHESMESMIEGQKEATEKLKQLNSSIKTALHDVDFDAVEIAETMHDGATSVRESIENGDSKEEIYQAGVNAVKNTMQVINNNLKKLFK